MDEPEIDAIIARACEIIPEPNKDNIPTYERTEDYVILTQETCVKHGLPYVMPTLPPPVTVRPMAIAKWVWDMAKSDKLVTRADVMKRFQDEKLVDLSSAKNQRVFSNLVKIMNYSFWLNDRSYPDDDNMYVFPTMRLQEQKNISVEMLGDAIKAQITTGTKVCDPFLVRHESRRPRSAGAGPSSSSGAGSSSNDQVPDMPDGDDCTIEGEETCEERNARGFANAYWVSDSEPSPDSKRIKKESGPSASQIGAYYHKIDSVHKTEFRREIENEFRQGKYFSGLPAMKYEYLGYGPPLVTKETIEEAEWMKEHPNEAYSEYVRLRDSSNPVQYRMHLREEKQTKAGLKTTFFLDTKRIKSVIVQPVKGETTDDNHFLITFEMACCQETPGQNPKHHDQLPMMKMFAKTHREECFGCKGVGPNKSKLYLPNKEGATLEYPEDALLLRQYIYQIHKYLKWQHVRQYVNKRRTFGPAVISKGDGDMEKRFVENYWDIARGFIMFDPNRPEEVARRRR